MDNALVIDGSIAAVLLVGALIGAKRGLFRSLMGIVVVAGALVGAVLLADLLTPAVTDLVYPFVEGRVMAGLESKASELTGSLSDELTEALRGLGVDAPKLTRDALSGGSEGYIAAVGAAARKVTESVVHAALLLVLYLVLLIVLKLLTGAADRVLDLPILSTVNGVGGAALGLLEAALLLYVAVYVAARLGSGVLLRHANDTYLLPIFLNRSPVELISSFARKG